MRSTTSRSELHGHLCIYRAADAADLGRRIGWHVLRHSYASALVMRGVDMKTVQELMGHTTIQQTDKYAHLSPAVKREAVKKLDVPMQIQAQTELRSAWGPQEQVVA